MTGGQTPHEIEFGERLAHLRDWATARLVEAEWLSGDWPQVACAELGIDEPDARIYLWLADQVISEYPYTDADDFDETPRNELEVCSDIIVISALIQAEITKSKSSPLDLPYILDLSAQLGAASEALKSEFFDYRGAAVRDANRERGRSGGKTTGANNALAAQLLELQVIEYFRPYLDEMREQNSHETTQDEYCRLMEEKWPKDKFKVVRKDDKDYFQNIAFGRATLKGYLSRAGYAGRPGRRPRKRGRK